MPSKTRPGHVSFQAMVPLSEYEKFRERFKRYGATDWFINTALASFNRIMAEEPDLDAQVEEAIQQTLDTRRELKALAQKGGKE